jgi:large subunit ribosomal protein L3
LREFRTSEGDKFETGADLSAAVFEVGDFVNVQGIMKGRGFAGAVKRHGFRGAPASHGHDHPRAVGSIGQRFPQHTMKGKRMAGRMGGQNVTAKNLQIVQIDAAKHLIAVKGAVPGRNGGLVRISQSKKAAKK